MGHRVLGLTFCDDVVRVAVVETRLRSFELRAVYELRRDIKAGEPEWAAASEDEGGDETGYRPSVAELLDRVLVPALSKLDSVALSCPGNIGFVRKMSFPFKEAGRIDAALPFQMIGHVPVQPEDIHCSFEKVAVEGGNTEVLAVAVPREDFSGFLASVRSQGIDPVHVTLDGVCLASLIPWISKEDDDGAQMLIWAEGEGADLLVAQGRRPVLVRSVTAGEPVVQGREASPVFMREVLMTMAGASESGTSVTRVRVAGPEADVLVGPLAEVLGVQCDVLNPADLDIPGADVCDGLSTSMTHAVAVALAAASGGGPGSMNLMTGEYSREGGHGLLRENYRYFAVVLAIFAVLGAGRMVGRYLGLNAERNELIAEMKSLSKTEMGTASADFDGVLRKMKARSVQSSRVFPAWTAVDTLNRLMSAVMSMGKVDMAADGKNGNGEEGRSPAMYGAFAVEIESVKIEPRQLSVRGEANTIETLDGLVGKLKTDPCFHEVVTESTERIQFRRHQGWQRFSIRLAVDCAVSSRGVKVALGK
ncbi:MAG: hypothetical protein GXP54_05385 [Deltaproteobacteria bacterium]|nr:hypothetical protein [Deltaproteobacteria bacterium]